MMPFFITKLLIVVLACLPRWEGKRYTVSLQTGDKEEESGTEDDVYFSFNHLKNTITRFPQGEFKQGRLYTRDLEVYLSNQIGL